MVIEIEVQDEIVSAWGKEHLKKHLQEEAESIKLEKLVDKYKESIKKI